MEGNPAQFESTGSRLGFRVGTEGAERLNLVWQGARFPAYLCLGIATALLFLSIPILEAIRQRGFEGPAGSLWYFPMMNLILLGIAVFLLSLRRTILFDHEQQRITLRKSHIFRSTRLVLLYDEVTVLRLGMDQVYSGFAVAGSSAAQKYPVPSLRLVLKGGETVLLDRGGRRRLEDLGKRVSRLLGKPLETTETLKISVKSPGR
ncbi:MAG: hypothetical protein HY694_09680 [Deltaproteobacteria bacterium]|nr:hypothetical protein [Deltaproteobacteria bacterium]